MTDPHPTGATDDGTGAARRADRFGLALAAGLALPFVAALGLAASRRWEPVSDWAAIEVSVTDVGSAHGPLVGAYSRFGWNHPGPALAWVLALPDRLAGGPNGLLLGVAALDAAAVFGAWWIARRRGGTAMAASTGLVLALLVHALGVDLLVNPWNPWAALLPSVLLVFLAWDVARGGRWSIPVGLAVASFTVQCHLGYLPLAAALVVWSATVATWRVARRRRSDVDEADPTTPGPRRARPLAVGLVSAGVVVVLWALPIAQQLTAERGNLAAIVQGYGDDLTTATTADGTPGALEAGGRVRADGVGLLARATGRPAWLGFGEPVVVPGAVEPATPMWLLLPLGLLAGVGVVARRTRWADGGVGAVTAAVGLVATGVGLAAIVGPAYPWLVRPAWAPATLLVALAGAAAARAVATWRPAVATRSARPAAVVVAVVVIGLGAWTAVGAVDAPLPREADGPMMARLRDGLEPWLDAAAPGRVAVHGDGTGLPTWYAGVAAAVDRHGTEVELPGWWGRVFVPGHEIGTPAPAVELVVAEGDDAIARWSARSFAVPVARAWPGPDEVAAGTRPVAVFAVPTGMVSRGTTG
ncbi:MAG: hypothetical protein U0Q07_15835 [Acidimicrobiales bacterium]